MKDKVIIIILIVFLTISTACFTVGFLHNKEKIALSEENSEVIEEVNEVLEENKTIEKNDSLDEDEEYDEEDNVWFCGNAKNVKRILTEDNLCINKPTKKEIETYYLFNNRKIDIRIESYNKPYKENLPDDWEPQKGDCNGEIRFYLDSHYISELSDPNASDSANYNWAIGTFDDYIIIFVDFSSPVGSLYCYIINPDTYEIVLSFLYKSIYDSNADILSIDIDDNEKPTSIKYYSTYSCDNDDFWDFYSSDDDYSIENTIYYNSKTKTFSKPVSKVIDNILVDGCK